MDNLGLCSALNTAMGDSQTPPWCPFPALAIAGDRRLCEKHLARLTKTRYCPPSCGAWRHGSPGSHGRDCEWSRQRPQTAAPSTAGDPAPRFTFGEAPAGGYFTLDQLKGYLTALSVLVCPPLLAVGPEAAALKRQLEACAPAAREFLRFLGTVEPLRSRDTMCQAPLGRFGWCGRPTGHAGTCTLHADAAERAIVTGEA